MKSAPEPDHAISAPAAFTAPSNARLAAAGASKTEAHAAPRAAEPRRAQLHFELHGRKFPLPLVRGSVAGTPTWMLVDTGANSHVVAGWLARQVGLPLKKLGDQGADHAGRTIDTFRLEKARLVIDDWGVLDESPVLATDVPQVIEQLGIGAFISPQRLVTGDGAAIVLDLPAGELRATRYDEAEAALGTLGRALAPKGGRVCEDEGSPIHGLAFVLPGKVEGKPVSLLLDTGAQRSDLLLGSPAGHALAPRSVPNHDQLYAASGRMTSRTLKKASLQMGEVSLRTDVDLIPGAADPFCPRDGVVSMDLLRACVLVLGQTQMAGRCGALH